MEINGKKVIDARKGMMIEVTKEDCRKGRTKDPSACAAAKAILREHEEVLSARVHRGRTYLEYEDRWVRYSTSRSLSFELAVFDRDKGFEPGVYSIAAPSPAARLDAEKKRLEGLVDSRTDHSKNKTRLKRHDITNIRPRGANR
jgi:hypothetical protein